MVPDEREKDIARAMITSLEGLYALLSTNRETREHWKADPVAFLRLVIVTLERRHLLGVDVRKPL
jgi:hypothetical protein